MRKLVIADTSCLIILTKIDALDLLFDVYGKVTTTPEIAAEYGENPPLWIDINVVADKSKQRLLEMQIDKGESSAIALALETPNSLLIIDDFKARRIAERLALSFTGTIGVIIKAKLLGIIPSIKPIIERIKETDFRLSPELELQALIAAKEK